jgi:hypothetical protein
MRNRFRQRGFFLNPYRFAGTVQSGAFTADGSAAVTIAGAGIASGVASADSVSTLIAGSDQAASGAFSADGVGTVTLVGAGIAGASASAGGEGTATFVGASESITVDAADFDGTNDWTRRTSALTGAANSKKGVVSFWFYDDTPANAQMVFHADPCMQIQTFGDNKFYVTGGSGGAIFTFAFANTYSGSAWHHLIAAWDHTGSSVLQMYLDGVSNVAVTTAHTGSDLAWGSENTYDFGSFTNGSSNRWNGGLAEFYLNTAEYIDISVQANREKFRTSSGRPADLGATGSTPTGTAPAVYFHLDNGETANNFAVNRSGNGNFTVTGALSTFASSPSD